MKLNDEIVRKYISYFFTRIVGFKNQEVKYASVGQSDNEFLSIAMDKVDRLTRKGGRLRNRVWSNCYFIFHGGDIEPSKGYNEKVSLIKKHYPFLLIRSYVYFVFVNISKENQVSILDNLYDKIETKDYKIWLFNSKYEVREETGRTNLFGITLDKDEVIDDYIYLANPDSELQRMEAANSDAIDCVRAFTGDLELLEQTSKMLDVVRAEFEGNPEARVIVEGPARSGKTIIAASLLGEYKDSKFLLMNYFFYQAIVDGFHALSGWDEKEIEALVKNPELDLFISLKNKMRGLIKKIKGNLDYAIKECDKPVANSNTKKWLMENISELIERLEKLGFKQNDLFALNSLMNLSSKLSNTDDDAPFFNINKSSLLILREQINGLLSGKYHDLGNLEDILLKAIDELIRNSKQKFFHHNINKNISSRLTEGCWIERGNPTVPKMWSKGCHPNLIICDEVQRLGLIPSVFTYDEFDEVDQILAHSNQSFFTGDNFQMLNSKYDKGIGIISDAIKEREQSLTRYALPESVGVPAEIGVLMKWLTNPQAIAVEEVVRNWENEKEFEIILIEQNVDQLIELLDDDNSNKKHLASPIDYAWFPYGQIIKIDTRHRERPIIGLKDHAKDDFAYKFPYFCNEEIMPNYILSAYELISREVESLYVHIPSFNKRNHEKEGWYRKHLYVLFTRPTTRLVVNFDVKEDYEQMKKIVSTIKEAGAKVFVTFLTKSMTVPCNVA